MPCFYNWHLLVYFGGFIKVSYKFFDRNAHLKLSAYLAENWPIILFVGRRCCVVWALGVMLDCVWSNHSFSSLCSRGQLRYVLGWDGWCWPIIVFDGQHDGSTSFLVTQLPALALVPLFIPSIVVHVVVAGAGTLLGREFCSELNYGTNILQNTCSAV